MKGWLYIIKNEALAGVIKIGRTDDSPEFLVKKLDTSGSAPKAFQLLYKVYVSNSYMILQHIRRTLWAQQKNAGSGWFHIADEEGISLIRNQIAVYIVVRLRLEIRNGHGHNDLATTMRIIDQVLFLQENTCQQRNSIHEAREIAIVAAGIMKHQCWMHRDQLSQRPQKYL